MPKGAAKSDEILSPEFFSHDGIFHLETLKSFRPNSWLTHLQVANNHVVIATVKNTLIRFFLSSHVKPTEVEVTRSSDDRVHNLFLDPQGWHTIISMQSGSNFYTNRSMKKVRPLYKAKDLLIDSVAWNPSNFGETSTQEILIGTNDGTIFETVLSSDEGRLIANTPEQYWKQVAHLGQSVTGIEIIHHPSGSESALVGEAQRCVILATTASRMYQFAGWINASGGVNAFSHLTSSSSPTQSRSASLASTNASAPADNLAQAGSTTMSTLFPAQPIGLYHGVFSPDDRLPSGSKVTEFPRSFGYSDLKVYKAPKQEIPSSFAWMTGPGIFFGHFNTPMLTLPPYSILSPVETDQSIRQKTTTCKPSDQSEDPRSSEGKLTGDVFSGRVMNFIHNTKLISYPLIRMLEHTSSPLGICLSAFHIIIAYADRIKAVNVLDDQTVYSMPIGSELGIGNALGICRDAITGNVLVVGSQGVAQLGIVNENVRVWKIYLDRMEFEKARKFCQNPSQLDAVNIREAEHCFKQHQYMKSAELFANSSIPFEEAALKFSHISLTQPHLSPRLLPVIPGVAVNTDHDIMDSLLNATEPETLFNVSSLAPKHAHADDITTAAPLKALIASKLDHILSAHDTKQAFTTDKSSSVGGKVAMLVLWLAELHLSEISSLKDLCGNQRDPSLERKLEDVRAEFKSLLTKPGVLILLPEAKHLLYGVCESRGNHEELLFVAELLGDFDRVVDHYMQASSYEMALKIMASHPSCLPRIYEHALTLVLNCPEKTVNTWLALGRRLNPVDLLPAILQLPSTEAMRYLQHVVEHCGPVDQAIHHLLVSLCAEAYARRDKTCDHTETTADPLMAYLESASAQALNLAHLEGSPPLTACDSTLIPDSFLIEQQHDVDDEFVAEDGGPSILDFNAHSHQDSDVKLVLPYDPGFVLRTCKEAGHLRGTVFVLKLLGLHKQALQTAIDHNHMALAKEIAQNDVLSTETRRQLWIILARHLIGKKKDINEATNLLRECPLLKLEDILPFFPDFVTVDQFKDAICASLDSYHQRIEEVKREMHHIMRSSTALRRQLDALDSRCVPLDMDARCTRCNYLLLARAFYVFPCGHNFHTDCLVELVMSQLPKDQRGELMKILDRHQNQNAGATTLDLQDELDRIIASDCAVCGHLAISSIANLFFDDQATYDSRLAIWQ